MGQNCKPYMVLWYLLSIHSLSNPNAVILVTSLVLKHCAHALRQPRGFHLSWCADPPPRICGFGAGPNLPPSSIQRVDQILKVVLEHVIDNGSTNEKHSNVRSALTHFTCLRVLLVSRQAFLRKLHTAATTSPDSSHATWPASELHLTSLQSSSSRHPRAAKRCVCHCLGL